MVGMDQIRERINVLIGQREAFIAELRKFVGEEDIAAALNTIDEILKEADEKTS